MLKMLVLKMFKKYINIYKQELNLSDRDDTKQAKSLIFIVVPQVEQFPKVQTKKRCQVLLEPIILQVLITPNIFFAIIIIAIMNLLNLQVMF